MIFVRGSLEKAVRALEKEFIRSGTARELKKRRYFIKPSEERRREIREGIKKAREREKKKEDLRCRSIR